MEWKNLFKKILKKARKVRFSERAVKIVNWSIGVIIILGFICTNIRNAMNISYGENLREYLNYSYKEVEQLAMQVVKGETEWIKSDVVEEYRREVWNDGYCYTFDYCRIYPNSIYTYTITVSIYLTKENEVGSIYPDITSKESFLTYADDEVLQGSLCIDSVIIALLIIIVLVRYILKIHPKKI